MLLCLRIRLPGLGLGRRHLGSAGAALRLVAGLSLRLLLRNRLGGRLRGSRLLGLRNGVIVMLGHDRTFLLIAGAAFGPRFDIPSIRNAQPL